MSTQQHNLARLNGYHGPFFPPPITSLNKLFAETNTSMLWLRQICQNVANFVAIGSCTTSDDYSWFSTIVFCPGYGSILICLPWRQDWDNSNGTQADRSIAVYSAGCTVEQIEQTVSNFCKLILDYETVKSSQPAKPGVIKLGLGYTKIMP